MFPIPIFPIPIPMHTCSRRPEGLWINNLFNDITVEWPTALLAISHVHVSQEQYTSRQSCGHVSSHLKDSRRHALRYVIRWSSCPVTSPFSGTTWRISAYNFSCLSGLLARLCRKNASAFPVCTHRNQPISRDHLKLWLSHCSMWTTKYITVNTLINRD